MGKCFQSHIQKVAWAVSVAESSIPSTYPSVLSSVLYYTPKVLELPESEPVQKDLESPDRRLKSQPARGWPR